MPNFKIVSNSIKITLGNQWIPSTKFNSKDRLVDAKGQAVGSNYKGHQYRIFEKRERIFSISERIGRCFLGTLAVVCTLFLGLSSRSVRNLFIKSKENVRLGVLVPNLRSQVTPSISISSTLSSQKKAEPVASTKPKISDEEKEGIPVCEKSVAKIQTCLKSILRKQETDGVKFYTSQENHLTFTLDTAPDLIFKMKADPNRYAFGIDDSMETRYETIMKAQTVVHTNQLGLLVIPHAKLFTVNVENEEHKIIAEQKLDINPHKSAQEQYFQDYADSLDETIRQLAVFICKMGYSDVSWRNNPILNHSLDANGNRKIALIDIKKMGSPVLGLFGGDFPGRGLVACVTEKQGKIVETVAIDNNIDTREFTPAQERRQKELAAGRELKKYYEKKSIIVGDEPVQVEESTLNFSDYHEKAETLKTLALDLIKTINEKISKNSPDESVKGRRFIHIDTNNGRFAGKDSHFINRNIPANSYQTDEERHNATFLGCVVKKLADLGAIHKLVCRDGRGYDIQA